MYLLHQKIWILNFNLLLKAIFDYKHDLLGGLIPPVLK